MGRALGSAIQRHRGEKTASQLADEAGISLDVLRKLEQGRVAAPGIFLVAKIADALEVGLDDLVDEASQCSKSQA